MRPNLHPRLVNGRFGDPALFVEMLHRRDALLFDMGDLSALSARDLLRVSHVFVTHMHMDHFVGFDALLRVCVGRDKLVRLVGPAGFLNRVQHKLLAYEWDLVERYDADLVFEATEIISDETCRTARYRFKRGFLAEPTGTARVQDGVVASGPGWRVRAALLQHHGLCLGYAVAETAHVNVWPNRLAERELATGQWLQALKQAVLDGADGAAPIALPTGGTAPLAILRDLVSVTAGQKIGYVADVADTRDNRERVAALAAGADSLFLESPLRRRGRRAGPAPRSPHHVGLRADRLSGRRAPVGAVPFLPALRRRGGPLARRGRAGTRASSHALIASGRMPRRPGLERSALHPDV